jgi:large subunit ribosomal protein L3
VFKGKKMAGHMGNKVRTIQNLEIIKSDLENNLIFVKGSVPGSKNSLVLIQKNVKNIIRTTTLEKNSKIQTEVLKKDEKKLDTIKTSNQQKNLTKTENKKTTEKKEEKK